MNSVNIPKWFWACILGVAVAVACVQQADAAETRKAPIVKPSDSVVMIQTGWHTYQKHDDVIILYCVEQSETLLTCVVYAVAAPGVAGIAIVPDVKRTVIGS